MHTHTNTLPHTVNWEIFVVKIFSMGCCHTKIKHTTIFRQQNIYGTKCFLHENLNSRYEIHDVTIRLLALLEMLIRSCFQPENGLPYPKGLLSCSLPSQAIALANKEVEKVIGRTKKRGVQRTEYRSTTLWGSLSHCKTSPRQGFRK